ncbi:MAG: hypothetical protein AVDCRST_MAG67-3247, partial [uncultured Solirubrobacteraceae bacterium]
CTCRGRRLLARSWGLRGESLRHHDLDVLGTRAPTRARTSTRGTASTRLRLASTARSWSAGFRRARWRSLRNGRSYTPTSFRPTGTAPGTISPFSRSSRWR